MAYFRIRWRTPRRTVDPQELNSYPQTPAGFFDGFWPGSKRVESEQSSFRVRLQRPPKLNEFPVTAADAVPFSAYAIFVDHRWHFDRTRQKLPRLNERPQTQAGFFDGFWPGSASVLSLQSSFKSRIQYLPELNAWPVPGTSEADPSAYAWPAIHLRHQQRKEQKTLELNEYPATPAPGAARAPQLSAQFVVRQQPSRKLQTVVWPPHTPVATPPTAEPYAAYQLIQALIPRPTAQYLQPTRLSVFKLTDLAYYTGWGMAAFKAPEPNKTSFKRLLQDVNDPIITAVTPTTAAAYPAHIQAESLRRRETRRRILALEELSFFSPTIAFNIPLPAWIAVPTFRWAVSVKLREQEILNVFPATEPLNVIDYIAFHADGFEIQFKAESQDIDIIVKQDRTKLH